MRLSDLLYRLSRQVDNSLESINREDVGESIYKAMKGTTDSLVAFAMQWTIKISLKPVEAEAVLKDIFFTADEDDIGYYWERFGQMPSDGGTWRKAGREKNVAELPRTGMLTT